MRQYFRVTLGYMKYQFKRMIEYRKSFVINAISMIISYGVDFILIWVMITAFQNMNGWNKYEVMLLYAMSLASYALGGAFFNLPCTKVASSVHNGGFDDILLKPMPPLAFMVCSGFLIGYISHLSLSIFIMVVCFLNLQLSIDLWHMAYFILVVISGALIYSALFIIVTVPVFYTTKIESVRRLIFFFRDMSYKAIKFRAAHEGGNISCFATRP